MNCFCTDLAVGKTTSCFFITIILKLCIPCFYLKFWIKALLLLDSIKLLCFLYNISIIVRLPQLSVISWKFQELFDGTFHPMVSGIFYCIWHLFFVIITFLQRCILALFIQGIERIAFKKIKFRLLSIRLHPIWHVDSVLLKR